MQVTLSPHLQARIPWQQVSWQPADWRRRPAEQSPGWPDDARLRHIADQLSAMPTLVSSGEILTLRRRLAQAAYGRCLVVQMGDCAETFEPMTLARARGTAALAHRAGRLLEQALGLPAVTIGRIAGQFAKPRSAPFEEMNGVRMPAFRGLLINGLAPERSVRRPDPTRLLRGHEHAAQTLALLRRIAHDGTPMRGHWGDGLPALWTSHEALVLEYEEPQAKWDAGLDAWVLTSAHLPWVGERTRQPDGAHVRFLAGVANPVGCKIGPSTSVNEIVRLARILDPDRQPGRLVLIARMGADGIEDTLAPLVDAVLRAGHLAVWLCDPMHGNTVRSPSGHKTRHVNTVMAEIAGFVRAVRRGGGWPCGLHLETTADPVTECVGGRGGITEGQLGDAYLTICDPRLNAGQALEVVERFAGMLLSRTVWPAGYQR